MSRKMEIILSVLSLSIVLFMITYLVIAITITKGYYYYDEVEVRQSDNGNLYAVYVDSNGYWEKGIDKPIMRVYDYASFAEIDTINVYELKDEVFGTYKLLVRDTHLYQIGEKYYVRSNLLQRAFG